ncbi:MAG: DEAD/DEAH box helicase family protein, partial [Candidatus Nanoarchaeia archaeon]
MDELLFPHEKIREVQEDFLKDVARCLEEEKNMIIHAPTGLGKTTILGPALAHAFKKKKTIFFITPMHTQHKIAIETLKKIKEKHKVDFIAVDLIGKKWMCQQPGVEGLSSNEFGDYCSDMIDKGLCEYHTRIKKKGKLSPETEIVLKELKQNNPMHVEELCKKCKENKLCPYEVSCLLGQEAQVIIGDYFHVLSPSIRNTLFNKMNKNTSDVVLIFDEGHNLPNKTRDLLTATISTTGIDFAVKECKNIGQYEIADKVQQIREVLEKFVKEKTTLETNEAEIKKQEFYKEIEKIDDYEKINANLHFVAEQVLELKKRSAAYNIAMFMEQWLGEDEGFARILT